MARPDAPPRCRRHLETPVIGHRFGGKFGTRRREGAKEAEFTDHCALSVHPLFLRVPIALIGLMKFASLLCVFAASRAK